MHVIIEKKRRRPPEKGAERFSWGLVACRSGARGLQRKAHARHTHTQDLGADRGGGLKAPPLYGVIGSVCGARVLCSFVWHACAFRCEPQVPDLQARSQENRSAPYSAASGCMCFRFYVFCYFRMLRCQHLLNKSILKCLRNLSRDLRLSQRLHFLQFSAPEVL